MSPSALVGYTDRLSYRPGEAIVVHASSPNTEDVHVRLIRPNRTRESGFTETDAPTIDWNASGTYPCGPQKTCVGSFMHATLRAPIPGKGISFGQFVWVARSDWDDEQTLVDLRDTDADLRVVLRNSRLNLTGSDATGSWEIATEDNLRPHVWYYVCGSVSPERAQLHVVTVDQVYGRASTTEIDRPIVIPKATSVTYAAERPAAVEAIGGVIRGRASAHFTGKLGRPFVGNTTVAWDAVTRLAAGELATTVLGEDVAGAWSLSPGRGDRNTAEALVPGLHPAQFVNVPARGVTGWNWAGEALSFLEAPDQYDAVHFHNTDLADAGWDQLFSADLPADLRSGLYAIELKSGDWTDTIPFAVRAADTRNDILVLLPTFAYLAYANESLFEMMDGAAFTGEDFTLTTSDRLHVGDNSFGRSLYDHHADGSGVMYSSANRAILNMRPHYKMWQTASRRGLSGDMYLLEWLEQEDFPFDVATDLDLHQDGEALLDPYRVVITGAHPEYYSKRMLDAMFAYRDTGGRLMYLGGNGFYWPTEVHSEQPLVVEVRRGLAGVRSWESYPGEVTLVSTGEPGGLWRHRGRPPQKLVGVGFCAQGWGSSAAYKVSETGVSDRYRWVFDGVEEDPIGDYGWVMGGAAGDELDRADPALGTPPQADVLASSFGHSVFYQRCIEEVAFIAHAQHGGDVDSQIKSDIVFFAVPGGGAVFATGSIAWSGALHHNDRKNGVSQITRNVIRRFLETAEFE